RTNRLPIKIVRERFIGPVKVEATGLPKGVSVASITLPDGTTDGEVEFTAADDARDGEQKITVSGTGPSGTTAGTTEVQLLVHRFRPRQVDVMFVLDVTGSMQREINGVSEGIVKFAEALQAKKLDARVGLIAFRDRLELDDAPDVREPTILR